MRVDRAARGQSVDDHQDSLTFLLGGGEMGAMMRAHDWTASPLGMPATWPQSLKSIVSACLNSPMLGAVLWGPDLLFLYNDAYIPSMAERHPGALGQPVAQVWGSAWQQVSPPFLRAMATGEGFSERKVELLIARRGKLETTYWDFTAAPIRGEAGTIVGLLNQGVEITEQVLATRQLSDEREMLAQMFEQAPTFMALLREPNHTIVRVNPGYTRLIGGRDVVGKTVAEALPDAAAQGFIELLDTVYRTGKPFAANGFRYAVQAEPGGPIDERYVDFVYQPIKDADGVSTGIFVEGADVTERTLVDAALRRSERNLHVALEAGRFGAWTLDLRTHDFVTSAMCRINFGRAVDAPFSYADLRDTVHPDDRARMQAAVEHSVASGNDYDVEYRILTPGGEERWVAIRAQVSFAEDGTPLQMSGVCGDVTERKRLETGLRALNETLEAQVAERTRDRNSLWQLSSDIMLRCGFDGRITAVNPAWTQVLGWDEVDLVGSNLFDLVHPDDLEQTMIGARELSNGQSHARFDNRYRRRDGGFRWISWSTRPGDGMINAVGRDVTAERESAEALRAAEDALRQSQKMEAVGQLTGGLAHDFNNLLTGISGSLELLQARILQGRIGEIDRYVTAAQGAAKRAAALTHRLLAFSRRQTLAPKSTDVNRLVAGMEELIRRTVGPEILVEAVAAGGLWSTLVDPGQLENALLNLCINARDAMPSGGKLTIETGNRWLDDRAAQQRELPAGQYVCLCVSDNGDGMSSDVIARAFDPFFTTKPIGMGTGLGLSMIYGFVRQSGGAARIYSEVGQGTMVCLYLPRHLGDADTAEASAEPSNAPRSQRGETVLIIDDEPTVRMLVTDVLDELGYTAMEAADGVAGLRLLQSGARIDLLVTDVGLPGGMNGRQVADAARAIRPDLKVLFITGYAENAVLNHGHLEAGMHVLTKPFAMDTLAVRIKDLIASPASS